MHKIMIGLTVSIALLMPALAQKRTVAFPPMTKDGCAVPGSGKTCPATTTAAKPATSSTKPK